MFTIIVLAVLALILVTAVYLFVKALGYYSSSTDKTATGRIEDEERNLDEGISPDFPKIAHRRYYLTNQKPADKINA